MNIGRTNNGKQKLQKAIQLADTQVARELVPLQMELRKTGNISSAAEGLSAIFKKHATLIFPRRSSASPIICTMIDETLHKYSFLVPMIKEDFTEVRNVLNELTPAQGAFSRLALVAAHHFAGGFFHTKVPVYVLATGGAGAETGYIFMSKNESWRHVHVRSVDGPLVAVASFKPDRFNKNPDMLAALLRGDAFKL